MTSVRPGMVTQTVGPVNPLPQMSMNVPRPGPIAPPPIMQGMLPRQWSTAPMPQQSSMQQNIQRPVIQMTAAQQVVAGPRLQGVPQQQARNISPNALQDLLNSPNSPQQQQQQVLNILKSNPQLVAAFIKQRTAKHVANQCPVPFCLNIKQKLQQYEPNTLHQCDCNSVKAPSEVLPAEHPELHPDTGTCLTVLQNQLLNAFTPEDKNIVKHAQDQWRLSSLQLLTNSCYHAENARRTSVHYHSVSTSNRSCSSSRTGIGTARRLSAQYCPVLIDVTTSD